MITQRMAIEATAITAYESFVRSRRGQYQDWCDLPVSARQEWRYRVVELVKKETA